MKPLISSRGGVLEPDKLTRQAGLSIDNLRAAQVVIADVQVLRATDNDNP